MRPALHGYLIAVDLLAVAVCVYLGATDRLWWPLVLAVVPAALAAWQVRALRRQRR